jgi:uncharacterized protein DUF1876
MAALKRWQMDIFIAEEGGRTTAEARLTTDDHAIVVGRGSARVRGQDRDIPRIGDEIAVARALGDLSRHLLSVAQTDLEAIRPLKEGAIPQQVSLRVVSPRR